MAACCYWQSIFAQRFGDILGNTFRKTDLNESITGVKNITDETAVAAQKAAMLAVKNMYEITNIDSFDIYMQLPSEHIYYKNHLLSYNYNRPAGNVIIPDGIIAVTRAAFNDCEEITSVSLPKTIRHIGNYAFKDCKALTAITIPVSQENVFKIDSSVFMNVDKSKVTLYVPYGTSDTYASIEGWSEFKNISELAPEIFNLEIPDYGYTTLYLDYSVRIPDGVEAFVLFLEACQQLAETVGGVGSGVTAGDDRLSHVGVNDQYLFVKLCKASSDVERYGGLAFVFVYAGNGDDLDVVTAELNVGAEGLICLLGEIFVFAGPVEGDRFQCHFVFSFPFSLGILVGPP